METNTVETRNDNAAESDINKNDFYEQLEDAIQTDLARLKKSITIVKNLRLNAAEMEVETAALHHAELWHDIEDLKLLGLGDIK